MDVRQMLAFHAERGADSTVATIPWPAADAHRYGIVECDAERRVVGFVEKPAPAPEAGGTRLASMGLYVFTTEVLVDAVTQDAARPDSTHDFGRDVLPRAIATHRVYAYDFSTNSVPGMSEAERGYWRDVGTIDAYWQASADLVSVSPVFSLYNPAWQVRVRRSRAQPHGHGHRLDGVGGLHHQRGTRRPLDPLAARARQQLRGGERVRALRRRRGGAPCAHPPRDHRQERRRPARNVHRLRPRGRPPPLHGERGRHRGRAEGDAPGVARTGC